MTLPEFLRIVNHIPNCPLSKRDAIAIAAAFPHTSEGVQWQRFVPWAYLTLSMLDIEHKIRRRLPMLKFDTQSKGGSDGHDVNADRAEYVGNDEFSSTSRPGMFSPSLSCCCYHYCLMSIPVIMIIMLTQLPHLPLSNRLLHSFPIPSISPTTLHTHTSMHYHHHRRYWCFL